jgi:hypothetical protein
MPRCVNMVGTRCNDADHAALQRWYRDHVHQLFEFPGLLAARLLRLETLEGADGSGGSQCADPGAPPQYLCSYDFADAPAFQAYESSAVRAAAAADRELGWGREGIQISYRRAWLRRYRRERAHPSERWWVQCGEWAPRSALAPATDPWRPLVAQHEGALELYADAAALMRWSDPPAQAASPPTGVHWDWQGHYRLLWRWTR